MKDGGWSIQEKYRKSTVMARSVWWDKEVNSEKGTIHIGELLGIKFSKAIERHMVRAAINRNKAFSFKNLSKAFGGLGGTNHFIDMLKDVDLEIVGDKDQIQSLSQEDKLFIAEDVLKQIGKNIVSIEESYYGSDKFDSYKIKDVFEASIRRKYTFVNVDTSDKETGLSQKNRSETNIYEDIDNLDWYAYDDNFGTSEEKYLVRVFRELMSELEEKWTDIYLLRNEKAVTIYSFKDGEAFEPDYLMFANDKKAGNISWQIFIEPKGSQFLGSDGTFRTGSNGWKEEFLEQISEKDQARTLIDDDRYRIIGLPFFNNSISKETIKNELRDL